MKENILTTVMNEHTETILDGEDVTLLLNDAIVTFTCEEDANGNKKVALLVDTWHIKSDYALNELIETKG